MGLVLTLFVGQIVVSLVFAFVTAVVGRWLGARVLEVGLFFAPRLFTFHLGEVPVRVGLIPIGSNVRFWDVDSKPEERPAAGRDLSLQDSLFEDLSLVRRLTILLSGWIVVVLLAALILGPAEALRELGEGFRETFLFLWSPAFAQQALASFDALAQVSPLEAGALWAVKITSFNLLPFPLFVGGFILKEVFSSLLRRPFRWPDGLMNLSFFLLLAMLSLAVRALWGYLAR